MSQNTESLENIKELYKQVEHQKVFIELLSREFNLAPLSIRNNWFSSFYSIPQKHHKRLTELLQRTIAAQNCRKKIAAHNYKIEEV